MAKQQAANKIDYSLDNENKFIGDTFFTEKRSMNFGDIRDNNFIQECFNQKLHGYIHGNYNKPCTNKGCDLYFTLRIQVKNDYLYSGYDESDFELKYTSFDGLEVVSKREIIKRYISFTDLSLDELNTHLNKYFSL